MLAMMCRCGVGFARSEDKPEGGAMRVETPTATVPVVWTASGEE